MFQGKLDRSLGYSTPAWLDDIIVVTRESEKITGRKLFDVLNKLEKSRIPSKQKKIRIFFDPSKVVGQPKLTKV